MSRTASSSRVTPSAVNSPVNTGCVQEVGTNDCAGQVIDLVWPGLLDQVDERELVEQIGLAQVRAAADVLDALKVLLAGAADHPIDGVAILSSDAGDQCASNGRCLPLPCGLYRVAFAFKFSLAPLPCGTSAPCSSSRSP